MDTKKTNFAKKYWKSYVTDTLSANNDKFMSKQLNTEPDSVLYDSNVTALNSSGLKSLIPQKRKII